METPFLTQCEASATNPEPRIMESTLVCGDSSSEPVIRGMMGAMNTLNEHTTSLSKDVTSLEKAGRQRDEAIRSIHEDHSELQQTIQEKVVPRIDQLEANTSNLSSEVENMQKTLTAGMPATVVDDQHADSQQGPVTLASVSERMDEHMDEHDEKALGIVSSQSIPPVIEERLSKLETSNKALHQKIDALRKDFETRTNHDLAKARLTDLLQFVEEHRKNAMQTDIQCIQRSRTRALSRAPSAKRRLLPLCRSTPKREHSASNASTVSSGFGSATEELPNLEDVDEASTDHMQDEDLNDDSLPPSMDPNYSDEVESTIYELVINLVKAFGLNN